MARNPYAMVAAALLGSVVWTAACARSPAAPGGTDPRLAMTVMPATTGVQHGTAFSFAPAGPLPPGATFLWQFGDGATAPGPGPVSHVYGQSGSFTAVLETRLGGSATTSTAQVSVRSLLGTWTGTITGHTAVAPNRGALTFFTLTVFKTPSRDDLLTPFGSTVRVDGQWRDNAGCVVGTGASLATGTLTQTLDVSGRPTLDPSMVGVSFGIEQFQCNGSGGFLDLGFAGVADATFDSVQGVCLNGGPDCAFVMRRTATTDVCSQMTVQLSPMLDGDPDRAVATLSYAATVVGDARLDFTSFRQANGSWVPWDWLRPLFSEVRGTGFPAIAKPADPPWRLEFRCGGRLLAELQG